MQLPDMNLLVALDALLDEGSVVGAARRMNLSPAAMSRTLTRVREAMGDPILVRAGRGLVPTPKALELRGQVRDVVDQAALLFRSADGVDLGSLRRRFNIRANDFFVGVYGGRLFDTLDRQAPHCELRFVPEGVGDDEALREGRIDLNVSNTRPLTPEVKVQNLFSLTLSGWCVRIIRCSTRKSPPSGTPGSLTSACPVGGSPAGLSTRRSMPWGWNDGWP